MPLSAWRKWWRRTTPRSKTIRKKPHFRKCFLEILEDRTLLSNTYTVNLTTDNVANFGQQSGPTSGDLRWCIEQADLNPGSTIFFDPTVFPGSANTPIYLSQGELQISSSMKIEGLGPNTITVSGDANGALPTNGVPASRVFDVTSNAAVVTIAGLTITGGNAAPNVTPLAGNQGGDIFNGGNLTLQNDIVQNGFSLGAIGGPNGRGGAIYNAEGQGNTVLTLDNTVVQTSLARGPDGANFSRTGFYLTAASGGDGGPAQGGGIYNDATALLIVKNGSQIINNTARGGDGGNGGFGITITPSGASGGIGGNGGGGGFAQGGGIYSSGGKLDILGTGSSSILLSDNVAQGGAGGFGGNGGNGVNGKFGGPGGNAGSGGAGGFAEGGGVFNTGSGAFPSSVSVQYISFLGDQAIGGAGNNGGKAGNGGNGNSAKLGTPGVGGNGGAGGAGGNTQGGAIYTAWGSLTVPNVLFGEDANGVSDQALGGAGANGGTGGNGGNSTGPLGGVFGGPGKLGGVGGNGGAAGNGGFAKGGIVANVLAGGNVAFTADTLDAGLARGGIGGIGGNAGNGGKGTPTHKNATKSTYSAGLGGQGGRGGDGGAGGAAVGGSVFNSVGSLTITSGVFLSSQALAGTAGNAGVGGVGGQGGDGSSAGPAATGGLGGTGGTGGQGGAAQGGAFYNMVGAVTITNSQFKARSAGGIGDEAIAGSGGNGGSAGVGGIGGDDSKGPPGLGGKGGTAGIAGIGGLAEGGAGGNQGGVTTLTSDIFTSSLVKSGNGGNGGNGAKGGDGGNFQNHGGDNVGGNGSNGATGGNAGTAWGGAIVDKAGNLTISNSTFGGINATLGNQISGGSAGNGGIGGGWGHWGHRNSAAYAWSTGAIPIAGNGGRGGLGAFVYGGALSVSNNGQTVQVTNTTFTFSSITAGNGGNGGQAGLDSIDGANGGINGTGGDAGFAQGGAVSLSAASAQSATLSNVQIASSTAIAGNGGNGNINDLATVDALIPGYNGFGSPGGNGGSVKGVDLAAIDYSLNITNGSFNGGVGQGGNGGKGGSETNAEPFTYAGGAGGNAGYVYGGGIFFTNNLGKTLTLKFNGGGALNNKLKGGDGGNGGNAGGFGHSNIAGGAGGAGGAVKGGGIYVVAGSTSSINTIALTNLTLAGNQMTGGTGGVGGAGFNAPGGAGGVALGGGLFNNSSNGTTASTLTISGSTFAGDQANGGIGGKAGSGTTPNGGAGGAGGTGGIADGGGMYDGTDITLTVVNSTFGGGSTNSSTPLANANLLTGGRGGRGGDAGTPTGVPRNDGGAGGFGGTIEGANVYVGGNAATFINDTIVYGQAESPGLGGAGGSGAGQGGVNGLAGLNGQGLAGGYYAAAGANQVGNSIIDLNSARSGVVESFNNYAGLDYNSSNNNAPPDPQVAAGTNSYIETVSQTIALYSKSTGTSLAVDSLLDFWTNQGKLARADAGSTFANPTVIWDEQIQRFIIAEQDVDLTTHVSTFDIAVSTTATPATLTSSDWNFFQVSTTEAGFDAENPGSLGWNHDALVFTLNMVHLVNLKPVVDHAQINSISLSALVNNNTLVEGTNAFQTDLAGAANLRPTIMHGSNAGDPMWFVEEGGNNQSINVVKMANVLTAAPTFTTTNLVITPYSQAVAPLQPGGTAITSNINSGIQKAAEQNGLLVAAHTVSDRAGNEDSVQWYVIDVSSGTPALQQEGDITGGPGIYDAFPSIDINSQGTIGMTYLQSGTAAGQFLSMYVTGRIAADLPGTMATPLLVQAGQKIYADQSGGTEGDISAISVDSDGSFWAANEFANTEATANWGTYIAHFNLAATPDVVGTFQTQGYNILGSTFNSKGFNTDSTSGGTDSLATAAQLNIGPLMNNGGPTSTDALLNNSNGKSAAIDAGGNTLVTSTYFNLFGAPPYDQRGPGFSRIDINNDAVDVGAYELNVPIITNLTPNFAVEQGQTFVLTINGTGFVSGATVAFGSTVLFPSSITSTQIMVQVPGTLLPDEAAVNVTVSIPDGSGVTGEVLTSAPVTFNITEGTTIQLTGPGTQVNIESDKIAAKDDIVVTSSDPDTTFSSTTLPPGLSIDPTTGLITGTIDSRGAGAYSVTVYGTDNGVIQGSATFTWTVNDTTPPVLSGPTGTLNYNEGDVLGGGKLPPIQITATDADSGTFTDVLNGQHTLPPGLTIDPYSGQITGTIDSRAAGNSPYKVTITATDDGVADSITFTIAVADTTPPVVTAPPNQTNNESDAITPLTINATDADTFSVTGLPGGLSYTTTSTHNLSITGTIGQYAAGTYTVQVIAYDNNYPSQPVPSTPVTFTWTVNDTQAPTLKGPSTSLANNEGDTIIQGQVTITATDNASGFTDLVNGKHTLPTGLSINPTTGAITGTIGAYAAGTYNVTISASDAAGNVGQVAFTWTVNDTTPPTVTPPANQTNNEGQAITPVAITATDADTFQITGLPGGLTYNSTTGVISGTIGKYASGNYTVQVIATDNGFKSQPVTFTWTVNDTTPPTLSPVANQTNNEGDTVKGLSIQATDAESYSATNLPTGLNINATTGLISGIIDSRATGTYSVAVTAYDGTLSTSTTFTWTVIDHTPPTLTNPGTQNSSEGQSVNLQIQSQDAEGGWTATGLPTGLSINAASGLITGTIGATAAGSYNVTISADDGTGNTGSAQFTWNVADTTPPAITALANQSNNEGDSVSLDVTASDADSFSATGLPPGLAINTTTDVNGNVKGVISGTISNTASDNSPYTVTVFAYDNGNASSTTFTWTMADSASPSFTSPGDQISNEGDKVNVATNPVGADPGTIMAIGLPSGLSIDSNTGLISGAIAVNAAGSYNVSISGNDNGHSAGFTFLWTVNDTTPPTLTNPGGQNNNNATAISLAIHTVDADAGTLTAVGLPAGLSINSNTGVISGTLLAAPGIYSVTVAASDGRHGASITFPWVVNQQPTSTVITNVSNTYNGFFQVETVTAEVTDPEGFPINNGTVTFEVNGQSVVAPVVNGFATATIVTNMFSMDLTVLMNDLFAHSLDAVYSDPSGIFGSGSGSVTEPAMLLDLLLFLENAEFGSLAPQLNQLQNS